MSTDTPEPLLDIERTLELLRSESPAFALEELARVLGEIEEYAEALAAVPLPDAGSSEVYAPCESEELAETRRELETLRVDSERLLRENNRLQNELARARQRRDSESDGDSDGGPAPPEFGGEVDSSPVDNLSARLREPFLRLRRISYRQRD